MKCSNCSYEMDSFDANCPRCKTPKAASHPATDIPVNARAAVAAPAPHSEAQRRQYLLPHRLQYAAAGFGAGLALSLPLCFFLNQFRQMAMIRYAQADRSFADTLILAIGSFPAAFLFALPVLLAGAGVGWWSGKQWQETSELLTSATRRIGAGDSLATHAKLIGLCLGIACAVFFLVWQYTHAQLMPRLSLVSPSLAWTPPSWDTSYREPNFYYVIMALRYFLLVAGLAVGFFLGQLTGLLRYHQARNRNFAPISKASRAASSPTPGGHLNSGAWTVGVFSFVMPCIGFLLWMSYSKTDEEKAGAAGIGAVLGILAGIALAVLRAVLRQADVQ